MRRAHVSKTSREMAESLALQALAFLLGHPDHCGGFLTHTGLDGDGLRAGAGDAAFLGGVLDYILQDEALLVAFCADQGLAPDQPLQLRRHLPGAQLDF